MKNKLVREKRIKEKRFIRFVNLMMVDFFVKGEEVMNSINGNFVMKSTIFDFFVFIFELRSYSNERKI